MAPPNIQQRTRVFTVRDSSQYAEGDDRTAEISLEGEDGARIVVAKNVPWAKAHELGAALEAVLTLAMLSQVANPKPLPAFERVNWGSTT